MSFESRTYCDSNDQIPFCSLVENFPWGLPTGVSNLGKDGALVEVYTVIRKVTCLGVSY